MARLKNELSATQEDAVLFNRLVKDIKRFGAIYLSSLGNVSQTTIFKYARREPVNPRQEREIIRVVEKAKSLRKQEAEKELAETRRVLSL